MTEEQWVTTWDCRAMYSWLFRDRHCDSVRRCWLFIVASCRLLEDAFFDPAFPRSLAFLETCADDPQAAAEFEAAFVARICGDRTFRPATPLQEEVAILNDELSAVSQRVHVDTPMDENWFRHYSWQAQLAGAVCCAFTSHPTLVLTGGAGDSAQNVMENVEMAFLLREGRVEFCYGSEETPDIRRPMADLLRDIFGNPFRPVAFDPAWRSEAAIGIARGIYDDRAFERMPILADALQDAGCEHPDILAHCRESGVHVRGCWVVDLVLGKA